MVERPADVLVMDRTKPVRQDWLLRVDSAMRRIPGLGIFIGIALLENWWTSGQYLMVAGFAVVALASVAREFNQKP